ncbi:hypothetical protein [Novosphingobium sp.]|uniref:hypothetical protein n=1 Tax=Novosphingobium sp. TaxID=1874826 RepID=UPI002634A5C5|nr:hypothetical protein [Novosphingobium sp.]
MRPSVEEQLLGTCRILETVVAPAVAEPFARTILDNLIANLRMVTEALPAVPGFLRWDNAATLSLLQDMRSALPSGLAANIDAALETAENDMLESAAQTARNDLLRALLAEAACNPDLSPDLHRAIQDHMIARASRVPMRYVPSATPSSTRS